MHITTNKCTITLAHGCSFGLFTFLLVCVCVTDGRPILFFRYVYQIDFTGLHGKPSQTIPASAPWYTDTQPQQRQQQHKTRVCIRFQRWMCGARLTELKRWARWRDGRDEVPHLRRSEVKNDEKYWMWKLAFKCYSKWLEIEYAEEPDVEYEKVINDTTFERMASISIFWMCALGSSFQPSSVARIASYTSYITAMRVCVCVLCPP